MSLASSLEIWKKLIKKDFQEKLYSETPYESVRELQRQAKNSGYTYQQLMALSQLFFQEYTYNKDGTPYSERNLKRLIDNGIDKQGRIIISDNFFVLKFPDEEDEDYDVIFQEVAIGLQVNKLRNLCPNFVYTFGLCKTSPPSSIRKGYRRQNYHCAVLEHVDGEVLSRVVDRRSFKDNYVIYLQIWLCLALAQSQIGLTHYDLHTGNVLVVNLGEYIQIEYPWGIIRTNKLVKIIDWGRSFAYGEYNGKKITIGRAYSRLGIQVGPNYFYDCYLVLKRSLGRTRDSDLNQFVNFFGVNPNSSEHADLHEVSRRSYDWFKWYDLISNHSFARECFKKRELNLPDPLNLPRNGLPRDYTFKELERYLNDWRSEDYDLVRKQRDIEKNRLEEIRSMRKRLSTQNRLPVKLEKVNLNDYTQEMQEKILAALNNIVNQNPTRYLEEHLDYYIDTVLQRLDFLNRLIDLQIRK